MFKKSMGRNVKNTRGVNIASSDRPSSSSNDKENILLTEEEIREYNELVEREKILDQELSDLKAQEIKFRSSQETMNLLHKYNDIKDATQMILGAKAVLNGTTIRDLYEQYGLSMEED
ncbi:unnamed protein product [Xylocopa violacea]|uniref:DNA repair protein SWI5 homolog n=1 Tax=Xylocopa violacea TaxID=135666 RepID=A0ABP1NE91_XYLVO